MSTRISLYEFRNLPDQEQEKLIFNKGTFIDFKFNGKSRFALYAVDLFFVELEYDAKSNELTHKRAFIGGELLDKYSS